MGVDTNIMTELVGSVGFPIAVALFVLIRLEAKIAKMNDCLKLLAGKAERIYDKLRN